MAEFMMSKPFANEKKRDASTPGNIAYAVFVLLCFWAGAQLLNALIHAPGVFENLMQMQESNRPRIDMGFLVWFRFSLAAPCLALSPCCCAGVTINVTP